MKLIIGKNPEQVKLSQYFKKIESIAERKGIDVDDLLADSEINISSLHEFSKKNIFPIHKIDVLNFSKE